MADFNWQAAFSHPLTRLGAGMMVGSDPRRTGLGGLGYGLMSAQQGMAEQARFAEESERNRRLADLQAQTLQAKMAAQERQRAMTEAFAMTFPEAQRPAVMVNPTAFAQPVTPATPQAPVAVMGPDNTPIYVTREQALGMEPFKAPLVQVGATKPANIPGYAIVEDPNQPTGYRYEKVEGAPEKGQTPEQREVAKMDKVALEALASLDRLEELVTQYGGEPLPGGGRPSMESAVRRAALTMKNVAEMGALQGREEQMLYELIGDPTEAFASIKGRETYLQKIAEARRFVEDKRRIFGGQDKTMPKVGEMVQTSSGPVTRVED